MNKILLDLIIVIPMYNESANIEVVLKELFVVLDSIGFNYCIYLIDDGSKDNSVKVVNKLADKRVRVIKKSNSGHGDTVVNGYKMALNNSSWVFQMDSDNEIDAKSFLDIWNNREGYDAVFGIRDNRVFDKGRKFLSFSANQLVYLCFGKKIKDINVPFRLVKTSILADFIKHLGDNFKSRVPNVLMSIYLNKSAYKIKNVLVPFKPRQKGKSLSIIKAYSLGWQAVKEIISFNKKKPNA